MINSIQPLCMDLRRRFWSPTRSVTFYTHLFLAVAFGGGLGIWYQVGYLGLLRDQWELPAISAALFTYFPAIFAAALIDFTQEKQPYLRSFGLSAAGLFAAIFLLSVTTKGWPQFWWAIAGSFLAVLFWWVASGEKDCFKDIDPNSAWGGDVSRELPRADESGWKK